jgi:hypothetical protein
MRSRSLRTAPKISQLAQYRSGIRKAARLNHQRPGSIAPGLTEGHVFTLPERLKTGHKFSCRGAAGVRYRALSRSSDSSAAGDDDGRDRRAGIYAAERQQ